MSFNAICENKIPGNISEFTVLDRHIELDVADSYRPPDMNVTDFFLFLNQNICFGYSKEPSQ